MKTLKSLLILVLLLTLSAAAMFTRPSEASFYDYLTGGRPRTATTISLPKAFPSPLSERAADQYMRSTTFADNILWTSVSKDGKILFTGAFGHWYKHDPATTDDKRETTSIARAGLRSNDGK